MTVISRERLMKKKHERLRNGSANQLWMKRRWGTSKKKIVIFLLVFSQACRWLHKFASRIRDWMVWFSASLRIGPNNCFNPRFLIGEERKYNNNYILAVVWQVACMWLPRNPWDLNASHVLCTCSMQGEKEQNLPPSDWERKVKIKVFNLEDRLALILGKQWKYIYIDYIKR